MKNTNPINEKKALEVREFLVSSDCIIKLNVIEEIESSFQIMDQDGSVYSPSDEGLLLDESSDLNDDINWEQNENIYRGIISRDQWLEFPKDEFIEFLDEFIEEGYEDDDLEEFAYWAYDTHGMYFEECAGGGSCEQYKAWGQKGEYLVSKDMMHDQCEYKLKIIIE